MIKKYIKSFFQNHSFTQLKLFSTDTKLKIDDGKIISKNFNLNDLFKEENTEPIYNKRVKYEHQQEEHEDDGDHGKNRENTEKYEKIIDNFVSKETNEDSIPKENNNQFNSHINKIVKTNENNSSQNYKTNINTNTNNQNYKTYENTSNNSQQYNNKYKENKPKNKEELIDEMLHNKNISSTNQYRSNFNQNIKQTNSNPATANIILKRQKISFVREGMIVNFYLKKVNFIYKN